MLRKLVLAAVVAAAGFSSAHADDLLSKKWDDIVAQAKQEGELNWYVWYNLPEYREYVKSFEKEYGIKVNLPEVSSAADAQKKLLAEAGRATGDIDVLAMGGDATNVIDVTKVFYGPILKTLPDSGDITDKINGGDGKGYSIAYWGNQTGIAYDSNRVDAATLPQTLDELSAWMEKNPGQLGFNYLNGGAGQSFLHNVGRNVLGVTPDTKLSATPDMQPVWDWFNKRKDQFVITASNADSMTRINSGEFLLVPAWEDNLFSLIKKNEVGSHIKIYLPKWGMNGGGNIVAIPANSGHKAAAMVFISWLTSAKVQSDFSKLYGASPTNTKADFSQGLIPADQRQYTRSWTQPLPRDEVLGGFAKNVVEN
jgi:putative spermidine/putrescine transport system substrate-binding protein